jgi:hypothetical protein
MQTETLNLNPSIRVQNTHHTNESKAHQTQEEHFKQEAIKRNQLVKSIHVLGDCI